MQRDWDSYFSALIDRISSDPKGYLIPYGSHHPTQKEPIGEELLFNTVKFPFFHGKSLNLTDPDYTMRKHPGQVCFFGDEPYSISAVAAGFKGYETLTQAHMNLRRDSVSQAIPVYVPPRDYIDFQKDYVEHASAQIDSSAMDWAFKHSFKHVNDLRTQGSMNTMSPQRVEGRTQEVARHRMMVSGAGVAQMIRSDPALELAFIVYRASHIDYLDRMIAAVQRKDDLPPEQKQTALDVLRFSFDQFRIHSADRVFLPPIMMMYCQKMGLDKPHADMPVDHEKMREAISEAIEFGFDRKLFETNAAGERGVSQCPARFHVSRTAKVRPSVDAPTAPDDGLGDAAQVASGISGIYDYITAHQEAFKPLLDRVSQEITKRPSLSGSFPPH